MAITYLRTIHFTCPSIFLMLLSAYLYSRYRHRYWSSRGVATPPYVAFLGHIHKMLTPKVPFYFKDEVYKFCRSGICGTYDCFNPMLAIGCPKVIRTIMIKDFDHFTDRRIMKFSHERDSILNDMLFNTNGENWKSLRATLTPTFTSGKLRGMFEPVTKKAELLVSYFLRLSSENQPVEVKNAFSRLMLDIISTCAFGFESNCIQDKESVFAKRAALFNSLEGFGTGLKFIILQLCPSLFKALNLALFPPGILFFNDVIEAAIAARRKGEKRGDYLDLLLESQLESNMEKSQKMLLNDKKILSQSIMFLAAGNDTTSSTLAYAAYSLAKYPHEQKRLRQELLEVTASPDGFSYHTIMNAKFLDACLMESMRMYPVAPVLERVCSKQYRVPETCVTLKTGDIIHVPVWGIHMDEQYWPQPDVYKPDRFMPENKENITNYTFMPFGLGPRNCIAIRFATMVAKITLAKLILSMKLEVAPGFEELNLLVKQGGLNAENGIELLVTPLIQD